MKTATPPSLRVAPDLRQAAKNVLHKSQTLSAFVEHAVRAQVALRRSHDAFSASGLASRDTAAASGRYVTSAAVLKKLEAKLATAKRKA